MIRCMKEGLLWLDADKDRTFEEKVKRASDYYVGKNGIKPSICVVNIKQPGIVDMVDDIKIQTAKNTNLHHFWLGVGSE